MGFFKDFSEVMKFIRKLKAAGKAAQADLNKDDKPDLVNLREDFSKVLVLSKRLKEILEDLSKNPSLDNLEKNVEEGVRLSKMLRVELLVMADRFILLAKHVSDALKV